MSEKNSCQLCGGPLDRGYCHTCGFYAVRKSKMHYRLNESNASRRLDAQYGKKLEKQLERREKSHQGLHNDFRGTSSEVIKARREADARKKALQQEIAGRGLKQALTSDSMAAAARETFQSAKNVVGTLATELDQKLLSGNGAGKSRANGNAATNRNSGYQTSYTAASRSGMGTNRTNAWNTRSMNGGNTWNAGSGTYSRTRPLNTMQSKKSGKGILVGVVVIAFFLVAVFSVVGQFAFDIPKPWTESGTPEPEPAPYSPYEDAAPALAETGDDFTTVLTGGKYIVGVHLPEGLYKVTLVEGEGSLNVEDDTNDISVYEWFELDEEGEEEELYTHITELDEVRLFNGAHIDVYTDVVLSFETHNGQTAQMSAMENPLKDVFNIPKGTTLVCGVDFEPGVYDIQGFSDNGLLFYTHPYYWSDDGEFYEEILWLDEGMAYKNIALLDGAEIYSDDANFTLVPSPQIGNIDYDTYYDYE